MGLKQNKSNFSIVVSSNYKIAYVSIPKVACTSMAWWFAHLEGLTDKILSRKDSFESSPDLVIHDLLYKVSPSISRSVYIEIDKILNDDQYYSFALVRNPYLRFFSAWQSKYLYQEPKQMSGFQNFPYFDLPKSFQQLAENIECFLHHIHYSSELFCDPHFIPQSAFFSHDFKLYSAIIKLESPKQLEVELFRKFGNGFQSPLNYKRANETIIPFLPDLITPKSQEYIMNLYKSDFKNFNYDREIPAKTREFSEADLQVAIFGVEMLRGRHKRLADVCSYLNNRIKELNNRIKELEAKLASANDNY